MDPEPPEQPTRDSPWSQQALVELAATMPARLGPYRLVREIGRGGMGIVYRAVDETLGREVAVKVLGPWLKGRQEAESRLENEARALASLRHPGVVQVFGAGRHGDLFYFAMELLAGHSLAVALARERPSPERAMELGLQIAEALVAAHAAGIVHRDLKPHNVILDGAGRVKVADFGLARSPASAGLTGAGEILGTPTYMAPEQIAGHPATAAADAYALGVVLFEMLAGRPPFTGTSPLAVAMKHAGEEPPDVRALNPATPFGLGELAMRMLRKDPAERPPVVEVATRLGELLAEHRTLEAVLRPLHDVAPASADRTRSAWGVVFFADIVGFTRIAEAAAPDLVGPYLSAMFTAMRAEVEAAGGHVVNLIGDCCLGLFLGADDRAAVRAAVETAERLHAAVAAVASRLGHEVKLRIGMNAGDLLVGPVYDGKSYHLLIIGDTVNVASKVEAYLTEPGTTGVTEAVAKRLPPGFTAIAREGIYRGERRVAYEIRRV